MARGPKKFPLPGVDTLTAELWAGKRGVGLNRGALTVDEAKLILAFAVLPFDGDKSLLRKLREDMYQGERYMDEPKTLLDQVALVFRSKPDDCVAVITSVLNAMRGRSRVAQAVAVDYKKTARQTTDGWGLISECAIKRRNTVLRREMHALRNDEAEDAKPKRGRK